MSKTPEQLNFQLMADLLSQLSETVSQLRVDVRRLEDDVLKQAETIIKLEEKQATDDGRITELEGL